MSVLSVFLIPFFILMFIPFPLSAGEREDRAVKAAEEWLALVDTGKYGESWSEAASYFRSAVSEEAWKQQVKAVRGPLGKTKSRKLEKATFATSLPGAPDGEYVVIQFSTSFAQKQKAVETVTPMKDTDGKWRVSGYYIR